MDKKTSKNNLPSLGQMKNKYRLFIFMALLFITSLFLNISNSFALTLTGTDQVTTNSSTAYTVEGCSGSVTWGATGVGASISSNGVLTAGSASCGALTVTASCSDGSIATQDIRITNAGQWVLTQSCGWWIPGNGLVRSCTVMTGKYKYATYGLMTWPEECDTYEEHWPDYWMGCPPICDASSNMIPGMIICVASTKTYEWQCFPCTNGQPLPCTSSDCPNGGVQTCANSQWGACQCDNPCKDKDKDGYYAISTDCPEGNDCNDNDPLVYPDNSGCCPVQHLTPLTDPLAISMEEGSNVIYDGLTTNMQQAVDCLSDDVFNAGGELTINSAYRPPQYQQHLREVWNGYRELKIRKDLVCKELREQMIGDYDRHKIKGEPVKKSPHTKGIAIDANVTLPAGQNIDTLMNNCGLNRPISREPWHFELQR